MQRAAIRPVASSAPATKDTHGTEQHAKVCTTIHNLARKLNIFECVHCSKTATNDSLSKCRLYRPKARIQTGLNFGTPNHAFARLSVLYVEIKKNVNQSCKWAKVDGFVWRIENSDFCLFIYMWYNLEFLDLQWISIIFDAECKRPTKSLEPIAAADY